LSIRVHEGRNHLVRRMCGAVGLSVLRLVRTEISGLTSTSLRPGEWRVLTDQEIASLRRTA
jgi:23S rRNA pseudouridine2605 synthase